MTAQLRARSSSAALIRPLKRLEGKVVVPADKSIAHRALICAALAEGRSRLEMRRPGRDVLSTIAALRTLGIDIECDGNGELVSASVTGCGTGGAIGELGSGTADCGNSGTTMRLLAGALAGARGRATLVGDSSLSRRPMERIASPLRAMGAEVATDDGHAPLVVAGRQPLRALEHQLAMASAQVLGAVALAALAAEGRTTIAVPGATRDHTERLLAGLGASVERVTDADRGTSLTSVDGPASLRGFSLRVPGDFSSAAAWIVAAVVSPGAIVRLPAVGLNPTRTALLDVLREMGAEIDIRRTGEEAGEPVAEIVVASASRLRAVSVAPALVSAMIDELPLLAVAMAAADDTSEVRGAGELRVKESDRISAMARALWAIGARVEELPDGWRIARGRPRRATVETHGDHRIAIAMAVAAWTGVADGVTIDDAACVDVSYPEFWADAAALGAA